MRILLQTPAPVLARGFEGLSLQYDDLEAFSSDGDIPQLIRAMEERDPDVVLVDTPSHVDFGILSELGRQRPDCPVMLWVYAITVEMAHHAKRMGVRGVLRKDVADEFLVECLRKVAAGELWFDRALLNSMIQVREVRLSPRERQLMRLIAQGLSNKEIASQLMISEGTVKVYLAKLFRKVGVHDRYELAMHGLRSLGLAAGQIDGVAADSAVFAGSLLMTQAPGRRV
jgi:DNA-binding NarL/FixJ family response regulator